MANEITGRTSGRAAAGMGKRIRAARIAMKLSVSDAAYRCGVSTKRFEQFEREEGAPPTTLQSQDIARRLDVPWEFLFYGNYEKALHSKKCNVHYKPFENLCPTPGSGKRR